LQNLVEMIIEKAFNFCESIAGDRTAQFFPWVMTIFLWVLLSNWMGLLPGFASIGYLHEAHGDKAGYKAETLVQAGPIHLYSFMTEVVEPGTHDEHGYVLVPFLRSVSSDLSFTVTLAIISVFMTQVFGLRALDRHLCAGGGAHHQVRLGKEGRGELSWTYCRTSASTYPC